METGEILGAFTNAGLGRLLPNIQSLLQESIRLNITSSEPTTTLAGVSRIGGLPDVPKGFTWPNWKDVPMSFIAQVRLEDIAGFAPAKKLPQAGMISFFYDSKQDTYGGSPDDRGGWAVIFFDKTACEALTTSGAPIGLLESAIFNSYPLSFSREFTLPTSAAQHLVNFDWTDAEVRGYEDFLSVFPTSDDYTLPHHRMFGHPNQMQDDMQLQSALYSNGLLSIDDPQAAILSQKKEEWLLLLQVDSDARTGMKWATSGMLYFWINAAELNSWNLENTWLVLQAE